MGWEVEVWGIAGAVYEVLPEEFVHGDFGNEELIESWVLKDIEIISLPRKSMMLKRLWVGFLN